MRSCHPFAKTLIGKALPCALTLAIGMALPAGAAHAQAGRVALDGFVSPRCWIAPPAVGAAGELPRPASLAASPAVHCSDRALLVQVGPADGPFQLTEQDALGLVGSPALSPASLIVTISPRS